MVKYYDSSYMSEVKLKSEIEKLLDLARKQGYQYNRSKFRRDMNAVCDMNIKDYKKGNLSEDQCNKALLKILRDLEMQMFGELRYRTQEEKDEAEDFQATMDYDEAREREREWEAGNKLLTSRKKKSTKAKPKRKVVKKCKCK